MPWPPSRRAVTVGAAAAVVALATAGVAVWQVEPRYEEIPLYADGIVVDAGGLPQVVLDDPTAQDDPAHRLEQNLWIESGTVPGPEDYADMAEQALRDLDALVLPGGAAIAGANPAWRYVWPRDASFTAVALARTGHTEDAVEVLDYLRVMQDVASTEGVFDARYLPDGTGSVPDQRGLQLDGNGWVLWAVGEWYAEAEPGAQRDADLEGLRPLVVRSLDAIRSNVDPVTGVPGVFPDYWEVRETAPTLGTLAPLLAGVRAVGPVLEALGAPSAADVEALLSRAVDEQFAPDGYPRHLGGEDRDTSVAFLMPPFAPLEAEVAEAWGAAAAGMARPAGGLAPGEGWKSDGISWTPETAIWALTAAASGDVEQAEHWLDWLDAHRTERGALPEKVLWDGSPSAVAPLAWTASTVLITLDELDRLEQTG
ncbi:glycoside hydrolase family 15 [Actinotalea sp. C106]|uniref:glycoside hydrolase family 15 n=1 Tax=Actinotalea sp. C106 TaxID=2908644 RepID=UPI002028EEB5|nr:glycoside hydrolase family 15 [Actinotalea sp. C106]